MRRIIMGLVFITAGVLWGLQNYGVIDIDWNLHIEWHKIILPGILVLIGLKIFFGRSRNESDNMTDRA